MYIDNYTCVSASQSKYTMKSQKDWLHTLTLRSYLEKSISFHGVFRTVEDAHSALALLFCCFFISLKFYNRSTKNYPGEVCLLSH